MLDLFQNINETINVEDFEFRKIQFFQRSKITVVCHEIICPGSYGTIHEFIVINGGRQVPKRYWYPEQPSFSIDWFFLEDLLHRFFIISFFVPYFGGLFPGLFHQKF